MDFYDFIEQNNLTLTRPENGDGSHEYDNIDVSWGFSEIDDVQDTSRIFTVLDCDDELVVVHGKRFVNRMFYLVTDQSIKTDIEEFTF